METKLPTVGADASEGHGSPKGRQVTQAKMATLEIVSDPGEGAQKCAQTFGAVSAKMGNGVWTVEIIPAEVQPPPSPREHCPRGPRIRSMAALRVRASSSSSTPPPVCGTGPAARV